MGGSKYFISHKVQCHTPRAIFVSRHAPECCIFYTHEFKRCFNWYIAFSLVYVRVSLPAIHIVAALTVADGKKVMLLELW